MAFILLDAVMFHGQNIWHFMSGREYVKKKEKGSDNTVLIKSCFARLGKTRCRQLKRVAQNLTSTNKTSLTGQKWRSGSNWY